MNTEQVDTDISRYLMGENVDFSIYEPDLSDLTEFGQDVLNEVRKIPYGKTITYSELADRIGCGGGARAVGQALSKNPYPIVIPCHRVVAKSGIGGYSGGVGLKKRLLGIEAKGVTVCSPAVNFEYLYSCLNDIV